MRHAAWTGLWLVLAVLASACVAPAPNRGSSTSNEGQPTSGTPKRITIAVFSEMSSFRSQTMSTSPGLVEVEQIVNAGLVTVDDRGVLRPRLVENVPTVENGLWKVFDDGRMETTWVIRDGARWHDGAPFTSDDIRFTVIDTGKDRDLTPLRHLTYDSIDAIETPDSRTAIVRWNRVNIDADKLLSTMGTPWPLPLPKHLLERAHQDDKSNFLQLPYWSAEFVGLGAYKLKDWSIGSHVTLEANSDYVHGRPKIDEIQVRFVLDLNALMANITSGAVDGNVGRGLSLEQSLQLREMWPSGNVDISPQAVLMVFPQFINPNPAVMTDVRLRRAVLHAIDRQSLAEILMKGQSGTAHVFLNPMEPEYPQIESSIVKYEYDPRTASRLVEQLGYTIGPDGIAVRADGQALTFQFQSTVLAIHQSSLLSMVDYLKRVGIGSEIETLAPQRVDDREYRSTRSAFELSRTPNSLSSFLSRNHGSQTPLPEDNFRRYTNKSRYQNAEFDSLIDAYFGAIPHNDRIQVLRQIVQHSTENLNVMPIFYDVEPMPMAKRVSNVFARKGELSSPVWNVHEWDLK